MAAAPSLCGPVPFVDGIDPPTVVRGNQPILRGGKPWCAGESGAERVGQHLQQLLYMRAIGGNAGDSLQSCVVGLRLTRRRWYGDAAQADLIWEVVISSSSAVPISNVSTTAESRHRDAQFIGHI